MYQIIQGGATNPPILIRLVDGSTGDPFDLTSITQIVSCFFNADGTELMVSLLGGQIAIVGNPVLGKISITLTSAQTVLLALTDSQTIELAIGATNPIKIQIQNAYAVLPTVC